MPSTGDDLSQTNRMDFLKDREGCKEIMEKAWDNLQRSAKIEDTKPELSRTKSIGPGLLSAA